MAFLVGQGLQTVVDDLVEDGLRPRGGAAILLQDKGCHTLFQRTKAVSIPLAICPALVLFFSEKFLRYTKLWGYCVDLDIEPQFRPLRFNYVYVGSVDGSDAAQGRLPIWHHLVWYDS